MEKDKKDPKTLKNPSIRETGKEIVLDPDREHSKRIRHLENYIKELSNELEYTKIEWQKHYSHLCFFFLIVGCIVGFILGAVLL